MIYNARCRHCEARRSLTKRPDHYERPPRCRACGRRSWRLDRYRMRVEKSRARVCFCTGYYFPHRKGCKWCHHNPNLEQQYAAPNKRQAPGFNPRQPNSTEAIRP